MSAIPDAKQAEVTTLYERGLSGREIAEHFGVSVDAVYYALRRFKIKRRTSSENNVIRFNRKQPSFSVKKKLTTTDQVLKALGVALYWGEGYKTEKGKGIDFANSDPLMIQVFLRFLKDICGIDQSKLRVYLYCHSKEEAPKLIRYWSLITGIPREQFTKPYIPKRESKRGMGMRHGLIHIRYNDKKLLILLRSWIGEYAGLCVGGRAVNYTRL